MCDPILVTLLKIQPHYSQSSRENATPSSGTSPVASYREVPPPRVQSPSVNSRILMVCFTFLLYTYECFIRLKFVTETDIYLCSKDNTVVYAKGPLRNSAALVT